jgi:hypothetical protein
MIFLIVLAIGVIIAVYGIVSAEPLPTPEVAPVGALRDAQALCMVQDCGQPHTTDTRGWKLCNDCQQLLVSA